MRDSQRLRAAASCSAVVVGYAALAGILTWPLPAHLYTDLLGDPERDLGVYVWNLWVFRHELLKHGHLPFSTNHIFAYSGGSDFSLHNYAPLAGVLGAPLIGPMGVVGAFNVVLIVSMVMTGIGAFLLAKRLKLATGPACCAGAVFMASPVLTARETAHLSLVIAGPLPLFLWALLRALDRERCRDALLVGVMVAAAFYSDSYYAIYCVMMGLFVTMWRFTLLEWPMSPTERPRLVAALHLVLALTGSVLVWRLVTGAPRIAIGPLHVGLQTFYTPFLIIVLAAGLRAWLVWQPVVRLDDREGPAHRLFRLGMLSIGACLALIAPSLIGLTLRYLNGRLPETQVFWRSGPRGIDALAYLIPNPNHPSVRRDDPQLVHAESTGCVPGVCRLVSAGWPRRNRSRCVVKALPRLWMAFTGFFVLLSMGPFIHVAGVNTTVVGPWAFLRYVPIIGMARSPSRFAVVAALGLSLLLAFAVQRMASVHIHPMVVVSRGSAGHRAACRRRARCIRPPCPTSPYRLVAALETSDESGRLLELPTGIETARPRLAFQCTVGYLQTSHRRPLMEDICHMSPRWRKMENDRMPMLRALFALSEGRRYSAEQRIGRANLAGRSSADPV